MPKLSGRCSHTTGAADAGSLSLRPRLPRSDLAPRGVVPTDIYLNVAVSGVLTGLVYGLMALGLSVIFGVVRVVNFAHGEMTTVAMYLAVVLFATLGLDPLLMMFADRAAFCLCLVMPCNDG